jgi:chromosomal replication initiation ATPase DnaA
LTGGFAPFSPFYVYGLGGIGKSALLDACAEHAAREGVTTVHVDARNIEASPRGFLHAVAEALESEDTNAALIGSASKNRSW